ncbi:MAG: hypothetical protein Q4D53_02435 [Leptotrichiaceae bacterium]|nr:hypothetical protein [Leptotrichiaceae bacterium]
MSGIEFSTLNNTPYEKIHNDDEEAYRFLMEKAETYTKFLYRKEKLSDEIYMDNIKDIDIWSEKYRKAYIGNITNG